MTTSSPSRLPRVLFTLGLGLMLSQPAESMAAIANVHLLDVPDYDWYSGCFGTACGNLMGFWDRNGFPDFYTGPTGGGLAPMDSFGANQSIRSLWVTRAGRDGRPQNQPGHEEDYYVFYESTLDDPYVTAGRTEHAPDCLGDFTGLSQKKWADLNGECAGNIDGYSFAFWDHSGERRWNYQPVAATGEAVPDLQSGLRAWTEWRGFSADTFTQLSDFNTTIPKGRGFSFADLQAEIDAGYPVLLYLQDFAAYSRELPGMPKANPNIHGMLAYGYLVADDGTPYVRFRTSWASGDNQFYLWTPEGWVLEAPIPLPLRGVIGYHPRPKIVGIDRRPGQLTLRWQGPAARLQNSVTGQVAPLHWYVVERSASLNPASFQPVNEPTTEHQLTLSDSDCCPSAAYYRLRLVPRPIDGAE